MKNNLNPAGSQEDPFGNQHSAEIGMFPPPTFPSLTEGSPGHRWAGTILHPPSPGRCPRSPQQELLPRCLPETNPEISACESPAPG